MLSRFLWAALLVLPASAESPEEVSVVTHTHTEYALPPCFQQQIDNIMAGNPEGQTTGIEVKFVYVDAESSSSTPPQPVLSTSTFEYVVSTVTPLTTTVTSCSDSKCTTIAVTSDQPHVYTTWAPYLYTNMQAGAGTVSEVLTLKTASIASSLKTSSRSQSLKAGQLNKTANTANREVLTESDTTVTETVFIATSVPETTYEYSSSNDPVTTTLRNPLVSAAVVTSSLSNTIQTTQLTEDDVTIATFVPERNQLVESQTVGGSISMDPPTTSTIDLIIPSAGMVAAAAASSTGLRFVNSSSTIDQSSSIYSSVGAVSLSLDEASSTPVENSSVSGVTSSTSGVISSLSVSQSVLSPSSSSSSVASLLLDSDLDNQLAVAANLFEPISTDAPLSVFSRDQLPLLLPLNVDNNGVPYQTNKFSTNLILSEQTDMIWSYPYGMFWKKVDYYGYAVQRTTIANRVFGPKNKNNDGDSYFYNPVQNAEILISATSMSSSKNYLSVSDMKAMSTVVKLSPEDSFTSDYIEIPIVQGMGFVTSIYHGDLTVLLNSIIGISSVEEEKSDSLGSNTQKYRFTLFNDLVYLVYVTLPDGSSDFDFTASDSFHIDGSKAIDGLILQIAIAPSDSSQDKYYDVTAGMYVVDAYVSGSSTGTESSYNINYETEGSSKYGGPLLFALPHHKNSFTAATVECETPILVPSTTKGNMTAYLTDIFQMSEAVEPDVSFLPWSPLMNDYLSYTKDQLTLLALTAQEELSADIKSTVQAIESNYFAGKVLDKYAQILLVVNDILQDEEVAKEALENIKSAFEIFTSNLQYYPLMYDTRYGGITSTASQGGDTGVDYGSGYYNDHHFHYGYFIHAAAVVGHVDAQLNGTWAEDNKQWVNDLIRDVANPSEDDSYFPVSRMFDWFAGHSWAGGLFTAGDGRNQESSSEDYHFTYGMKLWGKVIGDNVMEARADLMLAIQKRAMNLYYLYSDDNTVVPSQIVPNKVAGILFDNKIAYTTYFGDADEYPEYVHGIHMLPLTAASSLIRGATFVEQEWDQILTNFVGDLDSGWAGILRLNQALFDPQSSYDFFSSDSFKSSYLDNGQSRTWSLAFAGGLANSS